MKWMLDLHFEKPPFLIHHRDPILLMGSCFTDNIGLALSKLYFSTLSNPGGILFDPDSICRHLERALDRRLVAKEDLIFSNEKYQSLDFHSDFSALNEEEALQKMNEAINNLSTFLPNTRHLILTLGSAFAYRYKLTGQLVANCHQFPADVYTKELLEVDYIVDRYSAMIRRLQEEYPNLRLIVTVSPVRHIRDGVVANNRSKARLIEAVHQLQNTFEQVYYFPAYEWIMDVLRDYRWYDLDLVHPNYAATESVFDEFCRVCMDEWTREQLKELRQIRHATEHRPRFPDTEAHRKLLKTNDIKRKELLERMPWIKF
ncbi:MAG: GSCFA domain-containing protein [Bacteroidia bacterium]